MKIIQSDIARNLLYAPICDAMGSQSVPDSIHGPHTQLQDIWSRYRTPIEIELLQRGDYEPTR